MREELERRGRRNDLTDVPGFRVGSAEDPEACTGCTVILCPPEGAVGGVEQRGGAPGTRETDPLRPLHLVDRCHAVLLTGGSAFGLDAAGGVVRYLERLGIGFPTRAARVPIVPAAVLYDLGLGRADVRPDAAMGEAACREAEPGGPARLGSVGAGCGASVGKVRGMEWAVKGGLGSASAEVIPGVFIGAVAAVNAFGDVIDPGTGRILAGARAGSRPDGSMAGRDDGAAGPGSKARGAMRFADTVEVMRSLGGRLGFGSAATNEDAGTDPERGSDPGHRATPDGTNTVIAVVATNARLDKEGANILASMAMSGFARVLRPCHTTVDGDTLFALASGAVECDVNLVGAVAADTVARAILRAVLQARSLGGIPAVRSLPEDP
jgi:L-aminopeptidase/D-esterase-like protein